MTTFPGTFPGRLARAASLPALLLYLLTLALGTVVILSAPLYQEMLNQSSIQRLEFFFIFFPVPVSVNLLTPTLIALVVYTGCFTVASRRKGGYAKSLISRNLRGQSKIPNWLIVMSVVASAVLSVALIITRLQESLGVFTGGLPPLSPPELFAELTTSPISEELSFRITTLGLLVAARTLISGGESGALRRKRLSWFILSFLEPDTAKTRAGLANVAEDGFRGIHRAEWILLGLSSVVFGVSHLGPQSNWSTGKVPTAALSGFIIGLSYLAYGAYGAILLHWFFNYYIQFFSLLAPAALPAQNPLYPALATLNTIVEVWSVFLGILGLILAILIAWEKKLGGAPSSCL